MSSFAILAAGLGANALWLTYLWLGSVIAASAISRRKGYGEQVGLGTGLCLSALGVLIWLLIPAKADSAWAKRRGRRRR